MSNYIPGSEHGRDSAPMVYLREPLPDSYSPESAIPAGNVMMYMNFSSASARSFSDTLANSQQPNSGIDIPNVGIHDSMVVSQQEFLPSIGESRGNEMNHQMMLMDQMGSRNQGLSLSLSSHIPPSGIQFHSMEYRNPNMGFSSFLSPDSGIESTRKPRSSECVIPGFHGSNLDANVSSYGIGNVSRAISDSKYLKATQQLLDEIVNVQKALKQHNLMRESMEDSKRVDGATSSNPQETNNLSAAEKQDFQNKLTKFLAMLDEVDRRYKQYYHQMQIVVSAFDVVAGCGAAKPYTTLALQTISRHFRSLRDAISGQIKVTQRSLGEADSAVNGKGVGISRLRFVDQQLRQQRAFQQLGMMQQHTWRPQRGLPENSVTILRAWLFEHFLHPYPKDSDKIMLARQTGLTRSQVSNWFINARVRLWKPMVEEMYKEEAGDAEIESNSSSEVAPKNTKDDGTKTSIDKGEEDINQSAASTFNTKSSNQPHSDFQKTGPNLDDYHLFGNMNGGENERFLGASYEISELGRFGNGSGGGVSLTLGLQHCEDGSIPPMPSLGSHHHNFSDMGGGGSGDGYNAAAGSSVGPGAGDFDGTDSGDRQARFGSSHLLHDFVA